MGIIETVGRRGRHGQGAERSRVYTITAVSEADAIGQVYTKVQNELGGALDGLLLLSIDVQETKVVNVWSGTATFGVAQGFQLPQQQNESRTAFEFYQETILAKKSLMTQRFPADAPDLAGAVGVQRQDGKIDVLGYEIPAGGLSFSKTVIVPTKRINTGLLNDLGELDKAWNAAPFAGFPAGEVLLHAITGAQRNVDEYELTFRFLRRKNERNIVIGGITVPFKRGWDFLEVHWQTAEDTRAKALRPKARAVYVHQLLESANFNALGLQ